MIFVRGFYGSSSPGRLLNCDVDGCKEHRSIGNTRAPEARKAARAAGWTHPEITGGGRADLCPAHTVERREAEARQREEIAANKERARKRRA